MTSYTNYPNELIQTKGSFKKPAHKLLYMYLLSFKNCDKIYPSIDSIAEAICTTRRTAMTIVQEVEALGLIKVIRVQGESNQYIIIGEEITPPPVKETPPHPEKKLHESPVKELHPITNSSLKTKNKINNISLTSESVIDSLIKEFPQVPVQEIANELESDPSVVINSINQFKGLLTYRVKNFKPVTKKPTSRKVTRTDSALVENYEKLDTKTSIPSVSINDVMAKINAMKAM